MDEAVKKSLSEVDPRFSQFLYEEIIKAIKNDDWVRTTFTAASKWGLKFSLEKSSNIAIYHSAERIMGLNVHLIQLAQKNELIKNALHIILKHELTHAFDSHGSNTFDQLDDSFLLPYVRIANQLLNFVHLVRRGAQINAEVFSKFLPLVPWNSEPAKHFMHASGQEFLKNDYSTRSTNDSINYYLSFFSFYPGRVPETNFTFFITDSKTFDNRGFLLHGTANPLVPHQLLDLCGDQSIKHGLMTAVLEDHNDTILYNAFSKLPPELQHLLDLLLIFEFRFIHNNYVDELCYPRLVACVRNLESDCLIFFSDCSQSHKTAYKVFLHELHAVLRERLSIEHLPSNYSISEICEPFHQNNKPALHTNTAPRSALSFFTFGFYSALVDEVLEALKLSRWNKFFLKPILQAGFLYVLGAELCEVALFVPIAYILNISSQYLNLGKLEIKNISLNIFDTIVLIPQFSALSSTKTVAASLAGNALGSSLCSLIKNSLFNPTQTHTLNSSGSAHRSLPSPSNGTKYPG